MPSRQRIPLTSSPSRIPLMTAVGTFVVSSIFGLWTFVAGEMDFAATFAVIAVASCGAIPVAAAKTTNRR
jgi:hypothetical protein